VVGNIFQILVVKPIFNLLVFIYALLPGHNFGLAIIIFTILVRLLMWPLVKKQLHQAKAMRKLQPEIKRIKQATKGDRQKESVMLMELYKERNINPLGSIGTLVVQLIILLGLYSGLSHVVKDPQAIISNSYSWLHNLSWLKALATDIGRFDHSLFGFIDLTRPALKSGSSIYWPAMALVVGSAISQYFTSKQLMPSNKDGRKLRTILKEASNGKSTDQSEVNAAVTSTTRYFIPIMIFVLTVNLAAALSLYWLVGGITAYFQQARALKDDETEMEEIADADSGTVKGANGSKVKVIEGEIVEKTAADKPKTKKTPAQTSKAAKSKAKRRKKR
jgi:YidC/Oxa1 family membrane protein insertase